VPLRTGDEIREKIPPPCVKWAWVYERTPARSHGIDAWASAASTPGCRVLMPPCLPHQLDGRVPQTFGPAICASLLAANCGAWENQSKHPRVWDSSDSFSAATAGIVHAATKMILLSSSRTSSARSTDTEIVFPAREKAKRPYPASHAVGMVNAS
jgi:hypothetical protein